MNCYCCNGDASRFGRFRNKNGNIQRYRCNQCGKTFSDRPLNGLRLERDKIVQIVKLLCEGVGVRAAARLTDCHPRTVLSVLETVGEKCAALLDQKIRNIEVGSLQVDEIWARVAVRQSRTWPEDQERGNFYTFLALDARTKLIISHLTGKRDYDNTDTFARDFASRIVGRVQVTTDGWISYPETIRKYLLGRLDYAVVHKVYSAENDCPEEFRKYSTRRCAVMHVKVRAGAPRPDRINTSFIERQNLSLRHFNKRFVRLGLGWSRKLANHRHAIALFVAAHNFCKHHSTLGCTPSEGAKITDHAWTIEELIENSTIC